VNQRAIDLCALNAERNGLSNVRAVKPDGVPAEVRFAGIWSNPPIRIGKEALHELLLSWLDRLDVDAVAWLVVQKHLGSDSLARWLEENEWSAERRLSRSGYRVLEVARR
jgi:16S rRNA (guanine1207-N2)-methyltransferase